MDVVSFKKIAEIILGILVAYLLANILTHTLLSVFRISGPAGAVVGLILFGVIFFSLLQSIWKLTGIGFFRFG
jgi:hypothetical protein